MAEETFQHIPWVVSPSRNRQPSAISSAPPSGIEPKTTTSYKPPPRRRSSPLSKTPISPTERPRGVVKRNSNVKSLSLSSRDGSSRVPVGTMNDPAGEITYTPTTHRISKAKKGKKVHACEFPGCPKVRTPQSNNQILILLSQQHRPVPANCACRSSLGPSIASEAASVL